MRPPSGRTWKWRRLVLLCSLDSLYRDVARMFPGNIFSGISLQHGGFSRWARKQGVATSREHLKVWDISGVVSALSPSFATASVLSTVPQYTEYRQPRSETPQCKWHEIDLCLE
jgi:hypothetical protein